MTERVDIANQALIWLGEETITSLDDDLTSARVMKELYEKARDAVLEAHDWSFAMVRFIPALESAEPVWGPQRAFRVPSNILRVVGVWPDTRTSAVRWTNTLLIDTDEQIDWVFEKGRILCDEEVVYAKGIERVEEEGRFSPLFVHALAGKLSVLAALPLTSSKDVMALMLNNYRELIQEAKSRDGLQGRSKRIRQRSLRKVR